MSKPKIILFDVDGVLIKYRHNFTDELAGRGYQNAPQIMQPYYSTDNTSIYKAGVKTEADLIVPYLEKLGWKGTTKDYLDAQCDFVRRHLDRDLMAEIGKIRSGGVPCHIATNQGPCQARFLLEDLDFRHLFDGYFLSCEIGCRKDDPAFWSYALQELQREKGIASAWDIVYFDDSRNNVDVASGFGIQGYFFSGNLQFENDMNMLGFDIDFGRHA